jgi:hypothetical protein
VLVRCEGGWQGVLLLALLALLLLRGLLGLLLLRCSAWHSAASEPMS